jgi:hypothetical protein
VIALGVRTHRAKRVLAQAAAEAAPADGARCLPKGRDEGLKLVRFADQKVEGNSLGGTVSDPGKLPEGLLKFFETGGHADQKSPGI